MAPSLDKFLSSPDQIVNTPKFGNYVDTFKYFTGLSDREPNTVNDLQMARIFGIKPTVLASNPELYALITNNLNRMTYEINQRLPKGQELQPYQLQAMMWASSRGRHLRVKVEKGSEERAMDLLGDYKLHYSGACT